MLYFIPGAIPLLPRDVIAYDWYYYPFSAGTCGWSCSISPNATRHLLRRHGIEYWGCPMNGAFRFRSCRRCSVNAWRTFARGGSAASR